MQKLLSSQLKLLAEIIPLLNAQPDYTASLARRLYRPGGSFFIDRLRRLQKHGYLVYQLESWPEGQELNRARRMLWHLTPLCDELQDKGLITLGGTHGTTQETTHDHSD